MVYSHIMNRRQLFEIAGALVLGAFLPPLRAAKAKLRRYVSPSWLTGERHWEHIARAEPLAAAAFSPDEAVAHRVCRVLSPAKSPPVRLGWDDWEGWKRAAFKPIHDRIRVERRLGVLENVFRMREAVEQGTFYPTSDADRTYLSAAVDTHWGPEAGRRLKEECSAFFTLPSDQVTVAHLDKVVAALTMLPGVPARPL